MAIAQRVWLNGLLVVALAAYVTALIDIEYSPSHNTTRISLVNPETADHHPLYNLTGYFPSGGYSAHDAVANRIYLVVEEPTAYEPILVVFDAVSSKVIQQTPMSTSYFSYTPFWDPTTDSLVALAYDTSNAFVIGRVNVTTGDFKQIAALDPDLAYVRCAALDTASGTFFMFAANATDAFQTSFAAVDMASSAVSYADPSNGRNFFPSTLTVTPNGTLMISQYTSLDGGKYGNVFQTVDAVTGTITGLVATVGADAPYGMAKAVFDPEMDTLYFSASAIGQYYLDDSTVLLEYEQGHVTTPVAYPTTVDGFVGPYGLAYTSEAGRRAVTSQAGAARRVTNRGRATRQRPHDRATTVAATEAKAVSALLVIDMQNDFMPPDGSLAVPDAQVIVPVINNLTAAGVFDFVIATKDWHPPQHVSFSANHPGTTVGEVIVANGLNQTMWPIHCVQGSPGSEFYPELDTSAFDATFHKGWSVDVDSYSGFYSNGHRIETGLLQFLAVQGVTEVYTTGLATDFCVKFTSLDSVGSGLKTFLVEDATKGVNLSPGDVTKAIDEMVAAGVTLVNSTTILAAAAASRW